MREISTAVLWQKILTAELGSVAHSGSGGTHGHAAKRRAQSLVEIFFALSQEMGLRRLLEIGANNAETSRRFVSMRDDAIAHAYEPSPAVFKNVVCGELPQRLKMINEAVGSRKGFASFFAPNDPHFSVWGSTSRRAGFSDFEEIQVPMITLEEAGTRIQTNGDRDVALWIDVEGTAFDVVTSGINFLTKEAALVYLEVNDLNTYENSATSTRVISTLLEAGFVPAARDNEFHDAWNIICLHESYFQKPFDYFFKWIASEIDQIANEKQLG